jgi:hypothetical protein
MASPKPVSPVYNEEEPGLEVAIPDEKTLYYHHSYPTEVTPTEGSRDDDKISLGYRGIITANPHSISPVITPIVTPIDSPFTSVERQKSRVCSRKRFLIIVATTILVIAALVLGIVLGLRAAHPT